MTQAQDLLALAERVERLTGPDREVACTVAKAIGWRPAAGEPGSTTSSPWAWCPDWTASLDAAMLLVPEGWTWGLTTSRSQGALAECYNGSGFRDRHSEARAATPALALTAAALRARALAHASKGGGE